MKKWIFVFIATIGSLYSMFARTIDYKTLYCAPEYARNFSDREHNIEKRIISYKNIEIHTPVVKDFDKLEIIGIDRAELPVVYYKYDNNVKTASIDDMIDEEHKIIEIENNSIVIKNLNTRINKKINF